MRNFHFHNDLGKRLVILGFICRVGMPFFLEEWSVDWNSVKVDESVYAPGWNGWVILFLVCQSTTSTLQNTNEIHRIQLVSMFF